MSDKQKMEGIHFRRTVLKEMLKTNKNQGEGKWDWSNTSIYIINGLTSRRNKSKLHFFYFFDKYPKYTFD